jgi:hypothetical protein
MRSTMLRSLSPSRTIQARVGGTLFFADEASALDWECQHGSRRGANLHSRPYSGRGKKRRVQIFQTTGRIDDLPDVRNALRQQKHIVG